MSSLIDKIKKSLPLGVNLLAVSKGHSDTSIREFAEKGQLHFGESRLQEALPKIAKLQDIENITWHFIGRLQKNKVRSVIKEFDFIHSLDSYSLIERVSRIAGEENKIPKIFLQVKFLEDASKCGFNPHDLLRDWSELITIPNINIKGLMMIPPLSLPIDQRKDLFMDCRKMANDLDLKHCSMGMSTDWKEAVDAGATWIRIGSLLFGQRPQ